MENKSIIKKSAMYFIGIFSSRVLSALLIPFYAFYVATDELGYFDYTQTLMNILIPVAFLAIWEAVLKYVIGETEDHNKRIMITTLNTFIFGMVLVIMAAAYVLHILTKGSIDSLHFIVLMMVTHAVAQIWQYYARALSLNKLYVIAGVIGSICNFVMNLLLIAVLKLGLKGLFLSYILSQASIFFVIEFKIQSIRKYSFRYFRFSMLKRMVSFSAPLVLNLISIWLISGANRVIISNTLGVGQNGLYSFANRFAIIITMLGSIISMALIEEAYTLNDLKEYAESFSRIIQNLFKVYFSLIVLAIPSIQLLYHFFQSTDFYQSANYVFLLLLNALFSTISTNFGSAFQVTNKTHYVFITTLIGAGVSIGGSLVLLHYFGIYGILAAQLAGSIAMMAARAAYAYKLTGLKVKWSPVVLWFAYSVLLGLLSSRSNIFVLLGLITVNLVSILAANKGEICKIAYSLKKS